MNNKPNYSEGSLRNQIVNLMHITGVITPRSYEIIGNYKSIANCIGKLKKDGVVEKNNNGEIFESLNIANYSSNLKEYFQWSIPYDHLEYFAKYGRDYVKKAKYKKNENAGESRRVIRSGEVTVLMHSAGIKTLPEDKKYVVRDHILTDSVYYQSREIKTYSNYVDTVEESGNPASGEMKRTLINSRMNGVLLSNGGNFSVYHVGKEIQTIMANGEYNLKTYIETMLANNIERANCFIDNAILYYYQADMFLKLLNPTKDMFARFGGLDATYKNLYMLPFDKNGRDMTHIMTHPQWDALIKEIVTEEKVQDTARFTYACDYLIDGTYYFIFCVPNISRFIKFVRGIKFDISAGKANKNDFVVCCFDFQEEFVKKAVGDLIDVQSMAFDDFLGYWQKVELNDKGITA